MADEPQGPRYPVSIDLVPHLAGRNRLTTAFRIILAIPHLILVGAPGFAVGLHNEASGAGHHSWTFGSNGLLGVVVFIGAIFSWFAIMFTRVHPRGLWDLARYYMRWRANAVAYTALLRDEYPPFSFQA